MSVLRFRCPGFLPLRPDVFGVAPVETGMSGTPDGNSSSSWPTEVLKALSAALAFRAVKLEAPQLAGTDWESLNEDSKEINWGY